MSIATRRGLIASMCVLVGVVRLVTVSAGTYSGGTGEPNDPYRIATAEDLNDIGNHIEDFNKCFIQTADINLAAYVASEFRVIGDELNAFGGIFDGNAHSIAGFNYAADFNCVGLFRCVNDVNAVIMNVRLVEPTVNAPGSMWVGCLVGNLRAGTIHDCFTGQGHVAGDSNVGGLVGSKSSGSARLQRCRVYDTTITGRENVGGMCGFATGGWLVFNCHSSGGVLGIRNVGGLVGNAGQTSFRYCSSSAGVVGEEYVGGLFGYNNGDCFYCSATGNVRANWSYAGGLAGYASIFVYWCFATGDVQGGQAVGGLLGRGHCARCYATGQVAGIGQVGGLIGTGDSGESYAAGAVSGYEDVGGFIGCAWSGTGHPYCFWNVDLNPTLTGNGCGVDPDSLRPTTTENMMKRTTYVSRGWDFVGETANGTEDIWTVKEGRDYPKLVWHLVNLAGDFYEVNLVDFAALANWWGRSDCAINDDCDGADIDFSGTVDEGDLWIFFNHWLEGIE